MDESENEIVVASPNDRLSSPNRFNCQDVASQLKEKLHLGNNLLNGFSCHNHLNLNGNDPKANTDVCKRNVTYCSANLDRRAFNEDEALRTLRESVSLCENAEAKSSGVTCWHTCIKPCNCKTAKDKNCFKIEPSNSRNCDKERKFDSEEGPIKYVGYESENQMPDIMRLIQKDLSEPYSIYTYRYFIHNWPKLCFLAMDGEKCVGAIVCKLDIHKKHSKRGYIAMLAVDENYRKRKIGSNLVLKAIQAMIRDEADEVVLETEITNKPALRLYENLGFVRDKRLFRYYLNGVDALRLKLWLR